jgi:hypothetical protein
VIRERRQIAVDPHDGRRRHLQVEVGALALYKDPEGIIDIEHRLGYRPAEATL